MYIELFLLLRISVVQSRICFEFIEYISLNFESAVQVPCDHLYRLYASLFNSFIDIVKNAFVLVIHSNSVFSVETYHCDMVV